MEEISIASPELSVHQKKVRHRKKQIFQNILSQMEFYFSDANLTKDRFLSKLVQEESSVDLSIFLRFNKIRALTDKVEDIANALKNSSFLKLTEDKLKVYRTTPLQPRENVDECTLYVERIPPDITHDELKKIFSEFGNVQYVSIPKYKHNKMIKGFAFVEFDTLEIATKCLEYFASIGCKLPSQMPPDKLYSILTYDPNDKKNEGTEEKNVNFNENDGHETETKTLIEIQNENNDSTLNKNENIKNEENSITSNVLSETCIRKEETVSSVENNYKEGTNEHKRKLSRDEDHKEQVKKLKTESDVMNEKFSPQTDELAESAENAVKNAEINESVDCGNKKRRKRKKMQKRILNIKEMGLQVLSKQEWKRLRNKYLDLQKSRMKSLKQQLHRARFGSNHNMGFNSNSESVINQLSNKQSTDDTTDKSNQETKQLNFIPGTIIHLQLPESCVDIKKFKAELKSYSTEIKYIDVSEGSFEAYVRMASEDAAKQFIECPFPASMTLLKAVQEQEYWKKAKEDRTVKFNKNLKKPKQRGRDKLLRKAEKELGKHIRFDDGD